MVKLMQLNSKIDESKQKTKYRV